MSSQVLNIEYHQNFNHIQFNFLNLQNSWYWA